MPAPSEYPIFDHWYQTCDWILQTCDRMPKHTRFTISGRIANLALDITALLMDQHDVLMDLIERKVKDRQLF